MMFFSISLMVTGSLLILRTQASSHGRGTYAAGKFGKIVGPMEAVDRVLPAPAIDQIVPIGNYVAERAALVAEGDSAIHATRALRAKLVLGHLEVILAPILQALLDGPPRRRFPLDLHEARYFPIGPGLHRRIAILRRSAETLVA